MPETRVIAYIDGFNLYFGLRAKRWNRYYWLDVDRLAQSLLRPGQVLVGTKYFTARIRGPRPSDRPDVAEDREAKRRRQTDFLDAITGRSDVQILEGHYLEHPIQCLRCGARWYKAEEKMTDVRIATELLIDAFTDRFDTALVISGDSDVAPPIEAVRERFQDKGIIVAFPPERKSKHLQKVATAAFTIGRDVLRDSQMPDVVVGSSGFEIRRPASWA